MGAGHADRGGASRRRVSPPVDETDPRSIAAVGLRVKKIHLDFKGTSPALRLRSGLNYEGTTRVLDLRACGGCRRRPEGQAAGAYALPAATAFTAGGTVWGVEVRGARGGGPTSPRGVAADACRAEATQAGLCGTPPPFIRKP